MVETTLSPAQTVSPPLLLEMRKIEKAYEGVQVLKGARLAVAQGEIHGLVGENGAGKSTLVKILAGEVARDSGEITWLGRAAAVESRKEAQELGVSMIHQELNLAPHLTVAENIFLGHEPARGGLIDRAREISETVALLSNLGFDLDARAPVRRLSLAQRQLVEIARAVARATRIVIMDEPSSSLSTREVEELFGVVRQLKERGTAVVFVTHRLEELAEVADRVTVLRDGETVHEGPMPRREFAELIRAMVGRELRDFFPPRASSAGDAALEVRELSRRKDAESRDFQNVSLRVRHGEIVGVAGLVGAGRTELAEAIFGVKPADHGRLLMDGKDVTIRSPKDAIRCGMALLTEDRKRTGLSLNLNVAQNITLANLTAVVHKHVLDLREEERVAQGFLERLRIRAPSTRQKVGRLSGGNQQKVVLAKWLFRQARVFIFDEPTRGVDVGAKTEIYRLMKQLVESGAAILMVSSELPEILGMTNRVYVMPDGRLAKELVTAETTPEEILRYATLGEPETKH